MGTHPIFESDFDCLTERSIFTRNQSVGGQLAEIEDRREFDALHLYNLSMTMKQSDGNNKLHTSLSSYYQHLANHRMNFHKNEQRFCSDCGHSGNSKNQLFYNLKIIKKSKREKNKEIIKFCRRCNSMKKEEISRVERNNVPENVTNKPVKMVGMTHSKMTHTKPNLGQKGKIEKKQKGGKKKLPKPKEKLSFGLSSFLKKF